MPRINIRETKRSNGKKPLSGAQTAILQQIADRIFPRTETAGAIEAGAVEYIVLALAGSYAGELPLYRRGLRAVERDAQRKFGATFAALPVDAQDSILADFAAGDVSDFRRAQEFFEVVRYHVLEGIFCEPYYGGNKNMIGWRLVGFPGQQFGYADAYIDREVDMTPVCVEPAPKAKQ